MAMNTNSAVIKNCKLFAGCSADELKTILETATPLSVKRGDPVFVMNDPSRSVYVVVRGAVDILSQANVRNQFVKVRTVRASEHFGELSVLVADRHRTSAFARENSELLSIPTDDYLALIRKLEFVNRNQVSILLGYYLEMLRHHVSIPVLKDVSKTRLDRRFLKLAPLKPSAGRKAVPLQIESDVMTVGFCLPLSKDLIDSVKAAYPKYQIKFVLLEETEYETQRKLFLNFYSGQGPLPPAAPVLPTSSRREGDEKDSLDDLRSSTLLLSQLPPDVFEQIQPYFEMLDYSEGDIIFRPEESSDRFYFVSSGRVELNREIKSLGVLTSYSTVDQYDVFFDTTLLGELFPQVTAIAQSACRVFSISRSVFEELRKRSDFGVHFSIAMAHLINGLNKNTSSFEFYPESTPSMSLKAQPLLPYSKIKQSKIIPLDLVETDLTLGVLVPKQDVLDDAIDSYLRGYNIKTCLITEESFKEWTIETPGVAMSENTVTVFRNSRADDRVLKNLSTDATIALEEILEGAITTRASDIHFEPNEKHLAVRYRIDGVIAQLWDNVALDLGLNILRRVKVLAKMNISEMRLPQDGQFKFQKNDQESSFRVSSVPTRFGEKIVLRATGRKNAVVPLQLLAPHTKITKFFNRLVKFQQGIFFITGPTGSGKSTTMYSILNELNTRDKNIITIEDPIEANISGINQIEINPSIGLTHESILRNVLRQDPDVIMIGEIRDAVSMQLALDAALAGQLVLTTIHATNSFEVIPRIQELGGATSHIASGLIGVLAQRLVRKLCDCKTPRAITSNEMTLFAKVDSLEPVTHIMDAVGCSKCHYTGFSGQIPIFEFWEKTTRVHNVLIDKGASEDVMRAIRESEVESLATYGLKMVAQGLTTVSEVNDVVFGITDLLAS